MIPHESQRKASVSAADGVVTGDMVAQYAYCARRFHLAYVEGRWAENASTDEGRWLHRRVDAKDEVLPSAAEAADEAAPKVNRSVSLADEVLRLFAKLDLVETNIADNFGFRSAVPVETKRAAAPDNTVGSWEPERVQLMAQGLVLRAHGYAVDHGIVYYAGTRTRVEVPFTPELEARTREIVASIHEALDAQGGTLPAPLDDSPKCRGCSLSGICLPDETLALTRVPEVAGADGEIRRLYPARDDAVPFYVQEQGAYVGKSGESIRVTLAKQTIGEARLKDLSQLVLCGNVSITPQTLHLLCEAGVPVVHLSLGHWFYGITAASGLRNAFDRAAQFAAAADPARALSFAKEFISAKVQNQRTMLRRNASPSPDRALGEMAVLTERVAEARNIGTLLGIEGAIAACYFGELSSMIRPPKASGDEAHLSGMGFDFEARNRRPPRDPVNAMLSFGYALLAKECTVALLAVGLDPYWGFLHQPRHGRPALALDLMEEFRPLVVDSAVVTAINTGMVCPGDFQQAGTVCVLEASGRKSFIRAYEARLDQMATHPMFDYRCSWRRLIALQAQILARCLRGDVPRYQGMTTR